MARALPTAGKFLERVGFPAVIAFAALGLLGWLGFIGVKAINANTEALNGITRAVESTTAVMQKFSNQ